MLQEEIVVLKEQLRQEKFLKKDLEFNLKKIAKEREEEMKSFHDIKTQLSLAIGSNNHIKEQLEIMKEEIQIHKEKIKNEQENKSLVLDSIHDIQPLCNGFQLFLEAMQTLTTFTDAHPSQMNRHLKEARQRLDILAEISSSRRISVNSSDRLPSSSKFDRFDRSNEFSSMILDSKNIDFTRISDSEPIKKLETVFKKIVQQTNRLYRKLEINHLAETGIKLIS